MTFHRGSGSSHRFSGSPRRSSIFGNYEITNGLVVRTWRVGLSGLISLLGQKLRRLVLILALLLRPLNSTAYAT
jgi:hypothetical protein